MLLKRFQILALEFATLILFWAVYWPFGLKAAIAATVVHVIADAVRRHYQKKEFSRLYVLSTILTVCFGAIDLVSQTPFMLKYEAVIGNLAIGSMFVAGALGERPIIQNVAEDWTMERFPKRADLHRFFMLLTLAWAAYFFAKAIVYLWIGAIMPMDRALAVRSMIGVPSLILMMMFTMLGRRLYVACQFLGLLPAVPVQQSEASAHVGTSNTDQLRDARAGP